MPNKTLYVRDEDVSLWENAEKAAKKARQSVSSVVAAALHAYLLTPECTGQLVEITVDQHAVTLAEHDKDLSEIKGTLGEIVARLGMDG